MRHRRSILGAAVVLALGGRAMAQSAGQLYAVIYKPGPKWTAGKLNEGQGLGPHARYMAELTRKGGIVAAGGFPVTQGGMAVFRASSDEEARAIVAADPAVTSGIMEPDLRRWAPSFDNTGQLTQPKR